MERLYTSITNKEQNNNYLQTGRTGEREDFMRENLFMTETFEAPVRIALDHGWSSIKGEHTFMETSVVPVEYTPLTNHGLLEYKGKKYIVGQGRLGKQATKTENENYFLLTLAAECQSSEAYRRFNAEYQNVLLALNIADDYFKAKDQVNQMLTEDDDKDKQIYDLRHEVIEVQIKYESAQKMIEEYKEKISELQRQIIKLEAEKNVK